MEFPAGHPYRQLLGTPIVSGQAILGLLAQITQRAAPIGLVLMLTQTTGSVAIAGVVSGSGWLAAAIGRPIQGRIIDQHGTRLVMAGSGVAHASALMARVAAAAVRSNAWELIAIGVGCGVALPPASLSMRVEWGKRTPSAERTAAYSLVYLTQGIAIMAGPLLVAGLVEIGSAMLALVIAAFVSGAASVGFASLANSDSQRGGVSGGQPVLRLRSLQLLVVVMVLLGIELGAVQLGLPALALGMANPALGGLLAAVVSAAGIAGSLLYGAKRWRADAGTSLALLLCLAGAAEAPLAFSQALPVVFVSLALFGAVLSPALATASLVVDRSILGRPAEAFGWLSTAVGLGTSAGTSVAGIVALRGGVGLVFLFAGCAGLMAALSATAGLKSLVQQARTS